jgi:D-alanine-D-alanine ligase
LVEDAEAQRAIAVALDAWRFLGCRDGGRVDLRSDGYASPHFLEVNPLAGLNPEISDLSILCTMAGKSYQELIGRIMESASERSKHRLFPETSFFSDARHSA